MVIIFASFIEIIMLHDSDYPIMMFEQLRKYFTFEVMVLDDKNVRRRFRASNYQVRFGASHDLNFVKVVSEKAE